MDIKSILSPARPLPPSVEAEEQITDQSMTAALTKSSQLMALLKKGNAESKPPADANAPVAPAAVPVPVPVVTSTALVTVPVNDATAKLKSVLFPCASPQADRASPETDKTKMLLAAVKGPATPGPAPVPPTPTKQQTVVPATPPRPQASGAELLTDGDIARKMNALVAKSTPAKVKEQAPVPVPLPVPVSVPVPVQAPVQVSVPVLVPVPVPVSAPVLVSVPLVAPLAVKAVKKSSIKLISPSDLEAL